MPFKKGNTYRFPHGASGNPGGVPKDTLENIARKLTDVAMRALVLDLNEPEKRYNAACAILDRGWGKPAQAITGSLTHTLAVGGIDRPPRETLEEWLARRATTLDALDAPAEPVSDANVVEEIPPVSSANPTPPADIAEEATTDAPAADASASPRRRRG